VGFILMSLLVKGGGITKLSELIIDADKAWAGMGISNIKEVAAAMAHGDVNYRGAAVLEKLTAGIAGQYAKTQGAGFPPIWDDMPGNRFDRLLFLTIPQPLLSLAVVEDHSGGGFTASPPTLVIPAPPSLSISELALFDQRYESGADGDLSIEGDNWEAQTFTTLQAHDVEIIEIQCRRVLLPGDVTVGIWATVADLPSGGDLTSVTFSGDDLSAADAWITRYVVASGLDAATKYAIVIRAPDGDGANYLVWRKDGTVPSYAGGSRCLSANGGVGWAENGNTDFMFREGEVL